MQDYELLYIVGGDESEEASTKVTDEVNAILLKMGGKVDREDTWGRRRLAYEIDKQEHGWYVVLRFSLDGSKTAEFTKQLGLNEKIIRTVLLRADELPTDEELAKVEEAAKMTGRDSRDTKREAAPAKLPAKLAPKEPKKADTAAEKKERQSKLDESLGELLKEEE